MDLPLYTTSSRSALSDLGSNAYQQFEQAVVLDYVMRQSGQSASQVLFRDILLRLRDGKVTEDDWRHLMTRTQAQIPDVSSFADSLRLFPTIEAVVEYNVAKLQACSQPIATIKAVHTGPNAAKASPDDASGLEAIICLAVGARVMLSSNLWVEMGLVNGAMGTIKSICYHPGGGPPDLPVAVTVLFDAYSGPTLHDGTVPICPLRRTCSVTDTNSTRLQLPLKLAWAITIHKALGLTLDSVVVDVGKKEFSSGLSFVACSRVRTMAHLLLHPPFSFQRLANLSKSRRLQERQLEDDRLSTMENITIGCNSTSPSAMSVTLSPPSLPLLDDYTPVSPTLSVAMVGYPLISSSPPPVNDYSVIPSSPSMDDYSVTPSPPLPLMDDYPVNPSPPSMDDFSVTPSPPLPLMDDYHVNPSPPSMDDYPVTPSPPMPLMDDNPVTPSPSPMDDYPVTPSPPSMDDYPVTSSPPLPLMDDYPATPSPPWMDDYSVTPSPPPALVDDYPVTPSPSPMDDYPVTPSPPPMDDFPSTPSPPVMDDYPVTPSPSPMDDFPSTPSPPVMDDYSVIPSPPLMDN